MAWLDDPTFKQERDSTTTRAWTLWLALALSACSDSSTPNAQETGDTGDGDGDSGDGDSGDGDGDSGDGDSGDGDGEPEPPCEEWIIQFGEGTEERAGTVAFDGDQSLYIGGMAHALEGMTPTGQSDAFLAKYSLTGEKQWIRLFGSAAAEYESWVGTTGDGYPIMAGSSMGSFASNPKPGELDAYVARFDEHGLPVWTRMFGDVDFDIVRAFAVDRSAGRIYVAGETSGQFLNNPILGSADVFLARFDLDGNLEWTLTLGSFEADLPQGMTVDGQGNVIITGWSSGDFDGKPGSGNADVFVIKIDPSGGGTLWSQLFATPNSSMGWGVATDADDNVYVVGETEDPLLGVPTLGNPGLSDAFIIKLSPAGAVLWTILHGTPVNDGAAAVSIGPDGGVYVAGGTTEDLDGEHFSGVSDAYVAKFDSEGTRLWTRLYGTDDSDWADGLVAVPGGAVLSGTTRAAIAPGARDHLTYTDVFVARVCDSDS